MGIKVSAEAEGSLLTLETAVWRKKINNKNLLEVFQSFLTKLYPPTMKATKCVRKLRFLCQKVFVHVFSVFIIVRKHL